MIKENMKGNYTVDEIKFIVDKLEEIFTRRTFLEQTPYEVLIRTIISQRTRDENTDKATENLFNVYHTMEEIADAPVDDIANLGDFADQSKWYTSVSGNAKYGFSEETSVGGMPIVPGVEITNRHGLLVTYYIRAKATPESLTVHYRDRTNGDKEFYSYPINVKQGTTFKTGPYLPEEPEANGIPTHIKNGDVENSLGKTQYVSSVLATMPEISATYRYSSYECVEVVSSEDGKDLYLYYTFNNTHSFVVDFGVPLHLTTSDIAISGNWTSYTATQGKYGTVEYNGNLIGGGITYNPTEVMQGRDEIAVTLNPKNTSDDPATHFIYLYPATNVLYEENVITNPADSGWKTAGTSTITATTTQATEKLGEENLHGYDNVYKENTGFSGGTAYKATITTDPDKVLTWANKDNPLTFEFTGTGFDIISECGTNTGLILANLYKVEGGKETLKKGFLVDTYFTGDNAGIINGTEILDYQVPVVRQLGLDYGNYKVTIFGLMVNRADKSNATATSLYSLDSYSDVDYADAYLEEALWELGLEDDISLYEVSYVDESSVLNSDASMAGNYGVAVMSLNDTEADTTDQAGYVYIDGVRVYHTMQETKNEKPEGNTTTIEYLPGYVPSEYGIKYSSVYDIVEKNGTVNNEFCA